MLKKMDVAISPKPIFSNEMQCNKKYVLGTGRYSTVFRITYKDEVVAVKRIELITQSSTEDEHKFLAKLCHENVVQFVEVLIDDNFRYIVMELCAGTLFQVIKKTYNGPPLPSDNDVMYQIADGLDYIHLQNVIHLDINPKNILISMEGKIKLADFGLSKITVNGICRGICIQSDSIRGTTGWVAPEACQVGNSIVSTMADVFSCGCVFFVFLTRENGSIHPFGDADHFEVQYNIRKGNPVNSNKIKKYLPLAHIFLKMIESIPESRPSLNEVKESLLTTTLSSIPSHMNIKASKQTLAHPNPVEEGPNLISPEPQRMIKAEVVGNGTVKIVNGGYSCKEQEK